jgi:hypothetical protein
MKTLIILLLISCSVNAEEIYGLDKSTSVGVDFKGKTFWEKKTETQSGVLVRKESWEQGETKPVVTHEAKQYWNKRSPTLEMRMGVRELERLSGEPPALRRKKK